MKTLTIALLLFSLSAKSEVSFKKVFNHLKVSRTPIEKRNYKVPAYNSLQWRLKSDDDGVVTNTLRIEPLAIGQKNKVKQLIEQRNLLGTAYSSEIIAEQCLDKSLLLLDLYYSKESIKLLHKLKLTYQDLTKVLQKGVKRDLLKFSELLKMRERLVSTKLNFNKLVLNSRSMLAQLDLPSNIKPRRIGSLNFDGFIDVLSISEKSKTSVYKNIELEKLAAIAKIKELDFRNENQKDGQFFKHFQISHKKTLLGSSKDDDSISLEVSFNLPGSSYQNSQEKMIDWHKAKAEYSAAKRSSLSSLGLNRDNLSIKIRNYLDLTSDGYLKDLNNYLSLLKKSKSNSPYKIVQINEKILKQKKKILDLRYEITKDYLYILAEQGKLVECSLAYLTVIN